MPRVIDLLYFRRQNHMRYQTRISSLCPRNDLGNRPIPTNGSPARSNMRASHNLDQYCDMITYDAINEKSNIIHIIGSTRSFTPTLCHYDPPHSSAVVPALGSDSSCCPNVPERVWWIN